MFVNEQGTGLTTNGTSRSGTYSAANSGSSSVGLPIVANNAFGGYTTGATIENTSSTAISGTIQYYNLDGTTVGTAKPFSVGPHASYPIYQGDSAQGLNAGFDGTAIITVTSGSSASLLVTTNAQSDQFFYSYIEPN
jgi:hypothetical protein